MLEQSLNFTKELPDLSSIVKKYCGGKQWTDIGEDKRRKIIQIVESIVSKTLRSMNDDDRRNHGDKHTQLLLYQQQLQIWKGNIRVEPTLGSGLVSQDTLSSSNNHGRSNDWKGYKE